MNLTPKTRDTIYIALFLVNAALEASAQTNAFASAPNVAHYVALASIIATAMLQRFRAPDAPLPAPTDGGVH